MTVGNLPGTTKSPAEPERLAALGRVAGELIHDLANVVATLRARATLALVDAREGRLPIGELERLTESSEEMGAMLRDVLDTLKEQAASPEDGFDPRATVESAIRRFTESASPLDIRLDSDLPPGVLLNGRASFLTRAVSNLVGNAARHARQEIRISLGLADPEAGPMLHIAVEDDGPGVPPDQSQEVFEPLVHGEQGTTGLGLSSVLWSVANLGGEVRYRPSSALGGACFEIHLPVAERGRLSEPLRPGALTGHRLLLIEDDVVVRGALVRLLEQLGAEPTVLCPTSKNDEEILQEILRSLPDAILMDLKLGRHRGVALWEMLRTHVPGFARQVIFLSGLGAGDPDWEAARATGQPILSKPIDLQDLARAVIELVGEESASR